MVIREQMLAGAYDTSSEYLRELIRTDKDRMHLRGLLLAGSASSPAPEADAAYFDGLRERVQPVVYIPGQWIK